MKTILALALAVTAFVQTLAADPLPPPARRPDLVLWYDKPATRWEQEALPIGNGRLGAMLFGGTGSDHIQFNESSLWIGDENVTGSYQAFGDLTIEFSGGDTPATSYHRELDIANAMHTVTFELNGVHFQREAFASHPDQVLVFRYAADKPGTLSGRISLTDMHGAKISATGDRLMAVGSLAGFKGRDKDPYNVALSYESQVRVLNEGGTLQAADGSIAFENANSLILILSAGTDFVQDAQKKWRGPLPHQVVTERCDAAAAKPYEKVRADHLADYRALFGRVALDLGSASPEVSSVSTDQRIANYRKGAADPGLEALLFQHGRYLLISSSRPGGLPANLQGLWNHSNRPPWRCDFHSDVNLEMNYWPSDVTNLSDCFQPFTDYLWSIRGVRQRATAEAFKTRGWTVRGENGLFGGATWNWLNAGSAWYCQNLWDHYAFTGDTEYLRTRAYPMLKEVCEFWQDMLKPRADGKLVAPKDFSPEQMGFSEEGCTFDQELVWDLFTNTIEASTVLGVDADYRAKLTDLKSKLLLPQIGKWGQLQEWMTDRDSPKDTHRHTSHLVGLYPGRQIAPAITPELAAAARVSLNARGDASTGWGTAYRACYWPRLLDGERFHKLAVQLLAHCILPNGFDSCPPFQIDGNFGYTAAVCEALVQSHLGEIHLLPALPKAWPTGSVRGLRARGGFFVDMAWKDGVVTAYHITACTPREVKVRVNGAVKSITSEVCTPVSIP